MRVDVTIGMSMFRSALSSALGSEAGMVSIIVRTTESVSIPPFAVPPESRTRNPKPVAPAVSDDAVE
jgi:hypothetical protein